MHKIANLFPIYDFLHENGIAVFAEMLIKTSTKNAAQTQKLILCIRTWT
jgi:hypothetical protein